MEARPDSEDDVRLGVGIGGLVLSGASIAAGVAMFLAAESQMSAGQKQRAEISATDPTAANPCGAGVVLSAQCANLKDTQNAYNSFRGGGVAAMVTGSAFAVTGLIVLLTGSETANVEATPIVGPGQLGGLVRVGF